MSKVICDALHDVGAFVICAQRISGALSTPVHSRPVDDQEMVREVLRPMASSNCDSEERRWPFDNLLQRLLTAGFRKPELVPNQ